MEQGGHSGEQQPNETSQRGRYQMSVSPMTLATISRVTQNRRRAVHPGTRCILHDNTSPGYGWLLPGWIGEERRMLSGRVYRYYYDPSGRLYRTQHEVIHAWEQLGMVVVDM
ncbi:hypothetical protein CJ030_MR3G014715 [Morella rubra]|uniref:MBD domain-containing protein n=1 Tax=Morella rubra TaxID=262757 RepID=A0A6A1VYJ4_9ROSI|nr:hypothetical protein CJ030_MR3G014715 [Morella rubra]